jgi:hypothetical protein
MLPGAPCAGEPTAPDPEAGFAGPAGFEAPELAPIGFESGFALAACAGAPDPGVPGVGSPPEQPLARTIAKVASQRCETPVLDGRMGARVT